MKLPWHCGGVLPNRHQDAADARRIMARLESPQQSVSITFKLRAEIHDSRRETLAVFVTPVVKCAAKPGTCHYVVSNLTMHALEAPSSHQGCKKETESAI
jgi:hypothetical protein